LPCREHIFTLSKGSKHRRGKIKKVQEKRRKHHDEKICGVDDLNIFDFDKFNLRDEARAIINKHVEWFNKNKDVKIIIEGHCDERGTAEYNLALGERRANVAARYLIDMGIDGKRIRTISYGSERPLDPQHNEEAWTKNRRAHFVISKTK